MTQRSFTGEAAQGFYDDAINQTWPSGLWGNCPLLAIMHDPSIGWIKDYHFDTAPTDANLEWVEVDDGGTGTNTLADSDTITGSIGNIVTAAADNDYHAIRSPGQSWVFLAGKKLWYEAQFILTEATTNESAWWVGLTDTLTTGGFQANDLGPLTSYDGCLFWKDEASLLIDFETSNLTTQNTSSALATFVSGTLTKVGFYFDGTATTSTITPYWNVGGTNSWTQGSAQNITLSGLQAMHAVAGVKAGPTAAAETLGMRRIRIVQLY